MKRRKIEIKLLDMSDETYEELCDLIMKQIGEYEELNFLQNYFEVEIEYK